MGAEMNKFLNDLGEGLSWIWLTPEEARRLLHIDERGAFATADISFEVRPARLAA
jgi:hypothetical protein